MEIINDYGDVKYIYEEDIKAWAKKYPRLFKEIIKDLGVK